MRFFTGLVSLPFRTLRILWKGLFALALVASLALNIGMVTVNGVYAAVSATVSAAGIGTVAAREAGHRLAVRNAARATTRRITQRSAVRLARNASSSLGEAVPVLGVAVIAGALAFEVNDACATARDMAALEAMLDAEGDAEAAAALAREGFDCRAVLGDAVDVPTGAEIWQGVVGAPAAAWSAADAIYDDLPDFSMAGIRDGLGDFASGWFGGGEGAQ